jgi:SAM-dependent methyltransferase
MSDKPRTPEYRTLQAVHDRSWQGQGFEWEHQWIPKKKSLSIASIKYLGQPETLRVLDYGCGDAVMYQFFYEEGYQVEGIDISEVVIDNNKKKYPHLNFSMTTPDAPAPFPDERFDAVFSSEVIEHIYDVTFLFSEFKRLLRPGGGLILTTPYHGLVKNIVIALFYFESHYKIKSQHIRFFTKKSLTGLCREYGFTPVKWARVGRFPLLARSCFIACVKN